MARRFAAARIADKQHRLITYMRGLAEDLVHAANELETIPDLIAYAKEHNGTIRINSLGVVQSQGTKIDNAIGYLDGYVSGIGEHRRAGVGPR